jgi:superfamily I DNA/RNA helicase
MAWFIQKQIDEIAKEVRGLFDVLIISPMRKKVERIVSGLRKGGFTNVEYHIKDNNKEASLMEGIRLLLEDKECNLGWRIVAKALQPPNDFDDLIRRTGIGEAQPFSEMISKEFRKEVSEILTICRKIGRSTRKKKEKIDEIKLRKLVERAGFHPLDMMRDLLKAEISPVPFTRGNQGIRKIRIKATTVQSSKGLAADYVFITHIDDKWWFLNKESSVTDQYIRNFLVALTRARKKAFLISTKNEMPTFLKWIGEKHIQTL